MQKVMKRECIFQNQVRTEKLPEINNRDGHSRALLTNGAVS